MISQFILFQQYFLVTPPTCPVADWISTFKKTGWSTCGENNLFITGFYRFNPSDNSSYQISSLEQAICCNSTPEFSDQQGICTNAYWPNYLDRHVFTTTIPLACVLVCFMA